MAGVLQHLRSSTLDKRPNPASMVDGQIAINYASGAPGMFFKDSNGSLVKVGPVHVGSGAPNAVPASGGTAGNSIGEQWLDTSGGTYVFKIWDGAAWRSEAGEFVNATGDTMTGNLVMNNANLVFEGSVDDGFETTLTVVNPTADRTITLPNVTGTVVTTGDSGTVTSTMIADDTIVNADVNASAAIAGTKISPDFGSQTIQTTGIISAAAGSDAAPSIAFTGDTNTGIYSPGADQVAISTNGTGRLFISSTGTIGIGESSPVEVFEVRDGNICLDSAGSSLGDRTTERFYKRTDNGSSNGMAAIGMNGVGTNGFLGEIKFYTGLSDVFNASLSERARIDDSGRLLVGTSSARSNLFAGAAGGFIQLEGADANSIFSQIRLGSNSSPCLHVLAKTRSASVGSNTVVANDDEIGRYSFQGNDGTNFVEAASVAAFVDGTPGANDMPGRLVFSTNPGSPASSPTERMRITRRGVFKASNTGSYLSSDSSVHEIRSNTDNNNVLVISSAASNGTQYGLSIRTENDQNDATRDFLECQGGGVLRAQIRSNGGLANFSANNANLSDRNAKKDISPAADTWNCLKEWEIVNYRYKDQPDDADLSLGVIAQQVAESCPEVITIFQEAKEATDDEPAREERLGVKEQQMYWMAIKALQEAQARIETLEADVAALKAS